MNRCLAEHEGEWATPLSTSRRLVRMPFRRPLKVLSLLLCISWFPFCSQGAPEPEAKRLAQYRRELDLFRAEFGGTRDLPNERFFLFGMGLRPKLLYKASTLLNAQSGEVLRRWNLREDIILPAEYKVIVRTREGGDIQIVETEEGVFIESSSGSHKRERLPGTDVRVRLPDFHQYKHAAILRVLHQELLVNITTNGPVPNFFVYPKPWYRDGAMMGLALKQTGNLDGIHHWILNLAEPYDRNNGGETEADNLGQGLFLISLASDRNHPLVSKILAELPKFEQQRDGGKFIKGRSDFAEHPVYQTKWLKLGLRELGLPDPYTIPKEKDGYSALFWMDYKEMYAPGDSNDRDNYPYLGWACDHFHGEKKSPIGNRDYPLSWEAKASQARYDGMKILGGEYVTRRLASPHTWHAAEILLYLLEQQKK